MSDSMNNLSDSMNDLINNSIIAGVVIGGGYALIFSGAGAVVPYAFLGGTVVGAVFLVAGSLGYGLYKVAECIGNCFHPSTSCSCLQLEGCTASNSESR